MLFAMMTNYSSL